MRLRLLLPLLGLFALSVPAQPLKSYEITGSIVAINPAVVTIQRGNETFEVGRNATTKVNGRLSVGQRITIVYTLSAERIILTDTPEKSGAAPTDMADRAAQKAADRAERKAGR